MTTFAVMIQHRTKPGRRDDARKVWEKHMAPAIAANPDHLAYHYCFDTADPDLIRAFQVYSSEAASQAFLRTSTYASYVNEVEPLLSGPPQVTSLTPVWSKRT